MVEEHINEDIMKQLAIYGLAILVIVLICVHNKYIQSITTLFSTLHQLKNYPRSTMAQE